MPNLELAVIANHHEVLEIINALHGSLRRGEESRGLATDVDESTDLLVLHNLFLGVLLLVRCQRHQALRRAGGDGKTALPSLTGATAFLTLGGALAFMFPIGGALALFLGPAILETGAI